MILLLILILAAPLGATTVCTDVPTEGASAGEMGPGMVIMDDKGSAGPSGNSVSQGLKLHPGWNLVSWHTNFPEYGSEIDMIEILPPSETWFHAATNDGRVYKYDEYLTYFPQSGTNGWDWIPYYAYLMHMNAPHLWQPEEIHPLLDATQIIVINPDPAWSDNRSVSDPWANSWFFMGYAIPTYGKMATVYNSYPPNAQNGWGSPANTEYAGPFHWLYWDPETQGNPPYGGITQYLVIVKTDDGKVYLPYDPRNLNYPRRHPGQQEYDEIGLLEPGRGYFLGFPFETGTNYGMDHFQWSDWQLGNSIPPEPGSLTPEVCSAGHFQYNSLTHFFYPIFIDTVALEEDTIASGDEIGVFTPEGLCVGAGAYSGEFPLKLNAWKDDIATPVVVDGYESNDEMTFVLFDQSANQEITFVPPPGTQATEDDRIAPTHSGFGRGFYALRSLTYGVQQTMQLPQEFKLKPSFPNPFNSETVIPLELPQRSEIRIEFFNVKGQSLGVLYKGIQNAGWPKIRFNASGLASGMYFCRVTAQGLEKGGHYAATSKMLLLK